MMTAREFLEMVEWEGSLEAGLRILDEVFGSPKGFSYRQFPDADLVDANGVSVSDYAEPEHLFWERVS